MAQHFRTYGAGLVALFLLAGVAPASAQVEKSSGGKTQSAVAGEDYDARAFHRWLFGKDYRDLWTAPIQAEVLDMGAFAGGLTRRAPRVEPVSRPPIDRSPCVGMKPKGPVRAALKAASVVVDEPVRWFALEVGLDPLDNPAIGRELQAAGSLTD